MKTSLPHTRASTIALIAASLPLSPDAGRVRAQIAVSGLDWDDVLYLADGHGITPLLFQIWKRLNVFSVLPLAAQARMEQAYQDNATRNRDAQPEFRELVTMMDAAQVETIVMKGLPLLAQLYP